ncbi:MAG: leucine-rich repeat protein [Methanobrevibacter sp.]|nr:leucine-rich repeat protein [Methanobrevibacter sp.]
MKYQEWLNGCGCCPEIRECIPSSGNPCDCDSILLELSKQHTDDLTLQDEIDYVSGITDTKLDESAYTPVDLTDYYTKSEVDALIPEIPSLSGYATEQWVLDKHYITGVDLSDYATKDEIPVIPTNVSAFINDAGYVTNSELIQYITNLQEQINSLIASISGCCVSSGETQYRWITETGENDYWCSGTTKMSKEKQQSSEDGINWTDTGVERSGSTVLEANCIACGYSGGSRIQNTYSSTTSPTKIANVCSQNVERVGINYNPNPVVFNNCVTTVNSAITSGHTVTTDKYTSTIENDEYSDTLMWKGSVSTEITSIGNGAFSGNTILSSFTIGNYSRLDPYNQDPESQLTSIGDYAFKDCSNLTAFGISHCRNAVPTLGTGAFDGCSSLQKILVDNSMVNAFKTSPGWSTYSSIIEGI